MTRSELITHLHCRYPEVNHQLIEDAVTLFFFEVTCALQRNDRVELRGLGSFHLKQRAARTGRNPKTGKAVQVQEKWVPFFKGGRELKSILNQKDYAPQPSSLLSTGIL